MLLVEKKKISIENSNRVSWKSDNCFYFQIESAKIHSKEKANFFKMLEFMELNEDCLEHILKVCHTVSLVAVSQTCKTLHRISSRVLRRRTSFNYTITTLEQEKHAKGILHNIGRNITELSVFVATKHDGYSCGVVTCLAKLCPNLQSIKVSGQFTSKTIMDSVRKFALPHLVKLAIHRSYEVFAVDDLGEFQESVTGVARNLPNLQSVEIFCVDLKPQTVAAFIVRERNLNYFGFDMFGKCYKMNERSLAEVRDSQFDALPTLRRILDLPEDHPADLFARRMVSMNDILLI